MYNNDSKYNFYKTLENTLPINKSLKKDIAFITYDNYGNKLIDNNFVVYEDWWVNKPNIILSKIKSIYGINNRIFARKTLVKKIDKYTSDIFLEKNHIYGTTKCKHKLGLFYKNSLVAIATFSSQRSLSVGRSVELIRFCSKNGTTVVGGLDKLLKFYIREFKPNHIMTYIDLDWGNGESFLNIGFINTQTKTPIEFCIDKKYGKRYIKKNSNNKCDLTVHNRGSLKLEKYIYDS